MRPGAFHTSDRFVGMTIPKDCLDRLHNDILVDGIFPLLDMFDILRLRKVLLVAYSCDTVLLIALAGQQALL